MPDRSDATQEGTTLPNADAARIMARLEVDRAIFQHLQHCPFANLHIEERMRSLENRFSLLIGLMVGSGLLGGISGALLQKLIH